MTTTQSADRDRQQLPALTKIGGVWHCVISNELFKVVKPGCNWTVIRANETTDPQPVASGRTRKEALAAALTALSVSLALPEPTVTPVSPTTNAADGGVTIAVGQVSVFFRREQGGYVEPCYKCGGKGHILGYDHVQDGICFACEGYGAPGVPMPVEQRIEDVKYLATDIRKQHERAIIDGAKQRAIWTKFSVVEPELAKWMDNDRSRFPDDLRQLITAGKTMTPSQDQAARRAAEQYAHRNERTAAEAAARAERVATARSLAENDEVAHEGTVTLARSVDGRFGSRTLLLVEAGDGLTLKVFSTSKAAREAEEGDRVHITGTAKKPQTDRYEGTPQTPVARPRITILATADDFEEVAA
ncbi:hypothetical protein [Streptomyces candidus]|uniref:Uncharacterized protein n=1 Tax=Streptomyces candidus TaxID=67283 RepID=A0A7X0HMF7_9ACTN|nr:hypothetical protein [Streptomyces candidus]MBB6440261.1 hypothetical protein [Streptomyces candidus]GHH58208.1 hypothetical protein GCM10018773_66300 [Streptomyces candidus]